MTSLSPHPGVLVLGHETQEQTTKKEPGAVITAGTSSKWAG